ncbi:MULTISPECIES: cytochrome bd oxidase small subunit CydS [Ureibacillus]
MNEFMIFVAPFLTVLLSLIIAFFTAPLDKGVREEEK